MYAPPEHLRKVASREPLGMVVLLVAAAHRERSPAYTRLRDCGALRGHYDVDELPGDLRGITVKIGRMVKLAVVLLVAGVGLTAPLGADEGT